MEQRKAEEAWGKSFFSGSSSTTNLNSSLLLILWAKPNAVLVGHLQKHRIFVSTLGQSKGSVSHRLGLLYESLT
jgi:hypothetical protein